MYIMAIHILIISIKDFLANEMKIEGRNEQNLHKNNHTLSILLKHLNYSIWTNLHLDYFISVPDYRLHHFVDIINKCTYFRTIDIIIWQKFKDFIFHIPPPLLIPGEINERNYISYGICNEKIWHLLHIRIFSGLIAQFSTLSGYFPCRVQCKFVLTVYYTLNRKSGRFKIE